MKQMVRRVLWGLVLGIGLGCIAGCGDTAAPQEDVRTVSYRAVVESDKPVPEKVNTWLSAMSREDKIGQLMMIGLHGTEMGQSQQDMIRKYRVGGVLLTNENIYTKDQVKAFTKDIMQTAQTASLITPYVGINRDKAEHRGDVFLRVPTPNRWGLLPMERIINLTTRSAIELRDMGFNLIIGPNANVGVENVSYTGDPTWAGHVDLAMVERYQINTMWSTYNYFPTVSLGSTSYPTAEAAKEDLSHADVAVFKRLIEQTLPHSYMMMVGHVQIPAIDATHLASNSKPIITDWLRQELGYDGIVITDRADVGALQWNQDIGKFAVSSIEAGSDIILVDADPMHIDVVHRALTEAVAKGIITKERLNQSVRRILMMKMQQQSLQ